MFSNYTLRLTRNKFERHDVWYNSFISVIQSYFNFEFISIDTFYNETPATARISIRLNDY
jgi:hypothetical protein